MTNKHQHQKIRRNVLKAMVTGIILAINFNALAVSDDSQKEVKEEMNIHVIVKFDVKTDKISDFEKILNSVKSDLPKIEGCISVNVFRSSSTANKFTLVEVWKTVEFHKTHINNLSDNGTWGVIASHLAKDPESDYFIEF